MPARMETLAAIARHELRAVFEGKLVPAFGVLFGVLAVGIALAGLGGSGALLVQGFPRTAVSLLMLSLYLFPLLGLVLGAVTFGAEDGGTELLLAQPIARVEALLGRTTGLGAALGAVALGGFGAAGALIAATAGTAGAGGYVLVSLGALLVGLVGLAIGVLIGTLSRRRSAAVGWALAAWFAAAVLYDLAAIGILQLAGDGEPGPWLVVLLALNPVDGVRALGLVGLGADVLLGPTGASLERLLGPGGGAAWVVGSAGLWLAAPLATAALVYDRRDF